MQTLPAHIQAIMQGQIKAVNVTEPARTEPTEKQKAIAEIQEKNEAIRLSSAMQAIESADYELETHSIDADNNQIDLLN
jgi:hypothetical protein